MAGEGHPEPRVPEPRIIVDEDWKSQVEAERERLRRGETPESAAAKASSDATSTAETASAADAVRAARAAAAPSDETSAAGQQLPPASFLTLLETLAMQAMASLHEVAAPAAQDEKNPAAKLDERQFHLEMARHLIDTLAMLQDKTRGNLEHHEAAHLEQVLHDLRMAFVALKNQLAQARSAAATS